MLAPQPWLTLTVSGCRLRLVGSYSRTRVASLGSLWKLFGIFWKSHKYHLTVCTNLWQFFLCKVKTVFYCVVEFLWAQTAPDNMTDPARLDFPLSSTGCPGQLEVGQTMPRVVRYLSSQQHALTSQVRCTNAVLSSQQCQTYTSKLVTGLILLMDDFLSEIVENFINISYQVTLCPKNSKNI